MPPFSLQTMHYHEIIQIDDAAVRQNAVLIPRMIEGLEVGARIGDHLELPTALRDAEIRFVCDERGMVVPWGSGQVVVGLAVDTMRVQIGPYLRERHGYEMPEDLVATTPTTAFPGARGEAVELAVAAMDWWNGEVRSDGQAVPTFIDIAKRILGR